MKILSVSDIEVSFIYNPVAALRFQDVDLLISCGDLSYFYLEYILTILNVPAYYVLGNHAKAFEVNGGIERRAPWGAVNLHRRVVRCPSGLLLGGIEGSVRYNRGEHQYTQAEMWFMVWRLTPILFFNKLKYGRYLDIFITHASPWGIHDKEDLPHHGIKAFRWLLKVFQPAVHLHGHVHVTHPEQKTMTLFEKTYVLNAYRFREIDIDMDGLAERPIRLY